MHVDLGARLVALDDLGGEVAGGADEHAGLGEPGGVDGLRDAEVDEDRLAVQDQHVAGLEVAVDHPDGVHGGERRRHPMGDPSSAGSAMRAVLLDDLVQRGPATYRVTM